MTRNQRVLLLGIAVVIVAVAAIVIGNSGSDDNGAVSTTGGSTTPAAPTVATITVKHGKPVGGIRTITVNKGDRARYRVVADVTDEVHTHGYDIKRDVAPGKPASFSFPAKIDGEFVIELESRSEQIAKLVVEP